MDKRVQVLSATKVQEAFQKLGLPFEFSGMELARWQTVASGLPDSSVLCFPTPESNSGLNLLNLRKLLGVDPWHPPSFFDHPWYLTESFGHTPCAPGWHVIETSVSPESLEQSFAWHRTAHPPNVTLPTAVEVVLMLFLYYAVFGEQLLNRKHTWCADEASLGRFVTVGAFGRNGVFISSHPPAFSSRGLGLCRSFKLPENQTSCR
jgi:hypothetical protein